MLQKILGVITRPPVPMILGTIVALLVIWFGGSLLQRAYGWPSTFTISYSPKRMVPGARPRSGSIGVALALARQGVQIIRVHDVGQVCAALTLYAAVGGIDGRTLKLS